MSSNIALPTTQKAWMVVNQGKPRDALVFKTDVPVPKPKRGEVLVKVRAAALNPVWVPPLCLSFWFLHGDFLSHVVLRSHAHRGWKVMGAMPNLLSKRPYPAEHDLAGVIVDANGTSFSDGDEVIGFIPVRKSYPNFSPRLINLAPALQFSSRQGALAQYVTLPEDNATLKPTKLTWEESAGLPLAALTAVQSLRLGGYDPARALDTSAPTTANQESIFINGGSTAIGIYAIQLAKALSLRVTASASARNESFVRGVGADAFLDYTAKPIAEQLSAHPPDPRFGMVLDAAGSSDTALYVESGAYVKKGGAYVTTGPWPQGGWLGMVGRWTCAILRPAFLGGVPTTWKCVACVLGWSDEC